MRIISRSAVIALVAAAGLLVTPVAYAGPLSGLVDTVNDVVEKTTGGVEDTVNSVTGGNSSGLDVDLDLGSNDTDNTIVDLYDRVAPNVSGSAKWDFAQWIPDAVVINLGTNDFAKANPEEAGWIAAYVAFIKRIQTHYPKAAVYLTVGPMISEWPGDRKPRSVILGHIEKIVAQANAAGGVPVRFVDFGTQAQHNGIGAQWHPSVKTHSLMAEKLTAAFKRDLGW